MKALHRPDLYSWSAFDRARNVDFNGTCLVRPDGCLLIDPMPLSDHDEAHLDSLGPVRWIVVTNSDHTRAAGDIAAHTGALQAGRRWPRRETRTKRRGARCTGCPTRTTTRAARAAPRR